MSLLAILLCFLGLFLARVGFETLVKKKPESAQHIIEAPARFGYFLLHWLKMIVFGALGILAIVILGPIYAFRKYILQRF